MAEASFSQRQQPESPNNASPLSRLLRLSWSYRRQCVLILSAQIVLLGLGVFGLGLTGLAVDVIRHALHPDTTPPQWPLHFAPPADWSTAKLLFTIGGLILIMATARGLLSFAHSIAIGRLVHLRLVPELRTRVFDKIQRLSFRFYDQNASGSIINRVTGDVQSVRAFLDGVLLQGGIMVLSLCVYLTYMVRTHLGLTLACLAFTPLLWFITTRFSRWARPAYRRARELADEMVLTMAEGIRGIEVTKVFGREQAELERFRQRNQAVFDQQQGIFRRVSRFPPTVGLVSHLNVCVLLLYGGSLVGRDALSLGDLIVFAGLLQQFSGQVSSMAGIVNTLQRSLTAARRVFEVLDAPIEVQNPDEPAKLERVAGHLRFEGVEFGYDVDSPVLRGIDFEVAPGRSVAIVGFTGAGKSTLLSLIPRFYDPDAGRILIDGVDIRRLDLDQLRRNIGTVFQESLLFNCSVAENIAFGHPEADRAQIERAARIAGADDFIRDLPEGYDTSLNERAVNLSGGQRQRIAIARAILLEPAILLLDDPTTAVDPETEHEVLQAMDGAMASRTTVVVANRLSALRRADEILVVSDGRIAERGSHAELVERGGLYARAAALQRADRDSLRLLEAREESA